MSTNLGDEVWRCGAGHDVLISPVPVPWEMPTCPWCEAVKLRSALSDLKGAAWQFKMMLYGVYVSTRHGTDVELLPTWLEHTTANVRAGVQELQWKPCHDRLVAAIARADGLLSEVSGA